MKILLTLITFMLTAQIHTQTIVKEVIKDGVTITLKMVDQKVPEYSILIEKGGVVTHTFSNGGPAERYNEFSFIDFTGDGNDELYIKQYSGGAHCCEFNYILKKVDNGYKTIFNSEEWGSLNFADTPTDIDNNGTIELPIQNITYDYFDRCSHASSPTNIVSVFEFDGEKYLPSKLFNDYKLKGVKPLETIQKIDQTNSDKPEDLDIGGEYLGEILRLVLPKIYAGDGEEGWNIFDNYYKLSDSEKLKDDILKKLEDDPNYVF